MALIAVNSDGWILKVGGRPVIRRPFAKSFTRGWPHGKPFGFLWHYQAGCGADLSWMDDEGKSCHGNIDLGGQIRQYVSLDDMAWHAYDAAHRYYGFEHAIYPGTCGPTQPQLEASVALAAGLVFYHRSRKDLPDIPLRRVPGCDIGTPGFKEHADGVGCSWNPNRHTDHLVGMSWAEFLRRVGDLLDGGQIAYAVSWVSGPANLRELDYDAALGVARHRLTGKGPFRYSEGSAEPGPPKALLQVMDRLRHVLDPASTPGGLKAGSTWSVQAAGGRVLRIRAVKA